MITTMAAPKKTTRTKSAPPSAHRSTTFHRYEIGRCRAPAWLKAAKPDTPVEILHKGHRGKDKVSVLHYTPEGQIRLSYGSPDMGDDTMTGIIMIDFQPGGRDAVFSISLDMISLIMRRSKYAKDKEAVAVHHAYLLSSHPVEEVRQQGVAAMEWLASQFAETFLSGNSCKAMGERLDEKRQFMNDIFVSGGRMKNATYENNWTIQEKQVLSALTTLLKAGIAKQGSAPPTRPEILNELNESRTGNCNLKHKGLTDSLNGLGLAWL